MVSIAFMDLNDDVLRMVCAAAALLHPPHWNNSKYIDSHGPNPRRSMSLPLQGTEEEAGRVTYCLGWIYLTHVNRRLREVCFLSSFIWADIVVSLPTASRAAMDTLLSRARQAPLTLTVTPPYFTVHMDRSKINEIYHAKVAFVAEHLDRAVVCRVESRDNFTNTDWRPVFANRPLDQLRRLTFEQKPTDLQRLMSINTPNLIELRIKGDLFPLPVTQMPFLRKLDISLDGNNVDPTEIHNCDPLLSILRCAPSLENLTLFVANSFPRGPPVFEDAASREHVTLASLKRATVDIEEPSGTRTIWSRIEAPATAKLQLYLDSNNHGAEPTVALGSARSQLTCPAYNFVKLNHARSSLVLHVVPDDGTYDGVTFIWMDPFEELARSVVSALPSFIVPSNIKRLHLTGLRASRDDDTLSGFLGAFSAVTMLVYEINPTRVSPGLSNVPPDYVHPLELVTSSLLPALETLLLPLAYDIGQTERSANPVLIRKHWDAVTGLLQQRAAAGNPLKAVELMGARVADEDGAAVEAEALRVVRAYVQEIVDTRGSE